MSEPRNADNSQQVFTVGTSGVAHEVDRAVKFLSNQDALANGRYWTNGTDEALMVWYQTESVPDFIKLYGRIEGTLRANIEYTVQIEDNFDSASIGTNKFLYLTEVGKFGGKNFWLCYLFGGAAALLFVVLMAFFVCYFLKLHRRNRDNEDYLKSLSY